MKKISILLALLALVAFGACSGSQKKTEPMVEQEVVDPMAGYPAWILDPNVEDGLGSVGSAFIGAAGMQFARQEALANARDELARQVSVKVQNMFKSYTNSIGLGGRDGVEKVATNVSKQVSNQTLKGSRQKELWISPDKELFVQVVIPNEILEDEARKAVESQTPIGTSDRALWQEFKAKNAQAELDSAIDSMLQ
jgi:hypothetical protein